MKAIYVTAQFKNAEEIQLPCTDRPVPKPKAGECLIQMASSGVNPSDVRATMGYFPNCKLPRIPGRDFAGVVKEGNPKWVGKRIWGTGGAAGIESDGTHAEYAVIPEGGLAEIPSTLSLLEAGAQTLPFITAYYGLVTRGRIRSGETVLVIGALGQVGRAAMSVCFWLGCKPVALVRTEDDVEQAKRLKWEAYSAIPTEQSFDAILNSTGNLNWNELIAGLKRFGRMVLISALPGHRETQVNLFECYRKNQELIGINTLDLDHAQSAKLLNEMKPGFESKALTPLVPEAVFPLQEATKAYKLVVAGSKGKRVVLKMG